MVLVTPFFPEHIKIRLYLIIITKSTVNHDYNYTYVDLRTVVQKVFISCSGKKNKHEYSLFWQKTRISEHDTNMNTIPTPYMFRDTTHAVCGTSDPMRACHGPATKMIVRADS